MTILVFIVLLVLAPVLDGVERKIKARLHSRVGPPTILQSWYDILKLFSKELVLPEGARSVFIVVGLLLALSVFSLIILPYGYPLQYTANLPDLVILLVLIISLQLLWSIGSLVTANPFATIGVFREASLGIVNEFFLALGFIVLMLMCGSPSSANISLENIPGIAYIVLVVSLVIACYVASGRIPYDIGEAEPELASGILIEFSGPVLGMVLYSHYVKRTLLYGFIADLIILPFHEIIGVFSSMVLFIAILVGIWLGFAVTSVVLARTRVDLAPRDLLKVYLPLSILYSILGYIGV